MAVNCMKTILLSLVLFCLNLGHAYTQDKPLFILKGNAFNAAVNVSAACEMTIYQVDQENYRLKGRFDNKNLFGSFNIYGTQLPVANGNETRCMQFSGKVQFGGSDGSGFPEGTRTSLVVTLSLSPAGVKGVYHIGRIPPTYTYEQYGTLDLIYDR